MDYRSLLGKVFNGLLFYVGWGVCLEEAMWNTFPLRGPLVVLAILLVDLWMKQNRWKELITIVTIALVGSSIDTLFQITGLIRYHGGYTVVPWLVPLWMTSLWALFATSLNGSLSWLRSSYWLAAAVGAIGGPFCYMAAISLGTADVLVPLPLYLGLLAITWAAVMPLGLAFAARSSPPSTPNHLN